VWVFFGGLRLIFFECVCLGVSEHGNGFVWGEREMGCLSRNVNSGGLVLSGSGSSYIQPLKEFLPRHLGHFQ
jgi:hypothetical protein